ncbi:sugar phosphate isomerase/epimerase [Paenibacillus sp.]|uniref:sugar phosphate isomerase/epimerase family protein n=1 Tax=Paenibacillus sp. TaxID=58172 RepID=UPI00281164D5|nr:sugar phosphate isomerase/epimerase [Paenibacillus sp.]
MTRLSIGLQMYTLRNETAQDFLGTLRNVAELGYEGVEFAGYGGLDAKALRAELDGMGLKSLGSHVSLARMLEAADEEIEYALTLGNKYLVVPWMGEEKYATEEALAETCKQLDAIGAKCAERGIAFGYHNHSFELQRTFGGKLMLDYIFDSVPADRLQVELDSCWVHNAGIDAAAYIGKYKGRIPLVHLKDMTREGDKTNTVELGKGEVDLLAIAAASKEAGAEWLIVEQDVCQNPPLESVATSIAWLKSNGLR